MGEGELEEEREKRIFGEGYWEGRGRREEKNRSDRRKRGEQKRERV